MDQNSLNAALYQVADMDPKVSDAIKTYGIPPPRTAPGGFPALLSIIVNQQISKQAAAAILSRVTDLIDATDKSQDGTPRENAPSREAATFLRIEDIALQQAGLSRPKVRYCKGIAEALVSGAVDPTQFPDMSDPEIVETLTGLKGIGRWSAEIYCMFCLGRPDLFPGEDVALQEAIRRLDGMSERPNAKEARAIAARWSPWRSAMAVFLWHYYRGAPL